MTIFIVSLFEVVKIDSLVGRTFIPFIDVYLYKSFPHSKMKFKERVWVPICTVCKGGSYGIQLLTGISSNF